jgi:hypothetical protein
MTWRVAGAILLTVVLGLVVRNQIRVYLNRRAAAQAEEDRRLALQRLFEEVQPVALANCRLERFGEDHDGGYLMCANLLSDAQSGYSYGISGYDKWGCDISTRRSIPVHQYDCFNLTRPSCPGGTTIFHEECVGDTAKTESGRLFDSIPGQIAKNGDTGNHVVLKIDVEGAEWNAFAATPDDVLRRIDQLAVEFHIINDFYTVNDVKYLEVVRRLKRVFHVANLHFNNFGCTGGVEPFSTWAFEVLFVNKRLDRLTFARPAPQPHPLDARNNPGAPDCQEAKQ